MARIVMAPIQSWPLFSYGPYTVMAYTVMADIVMAFVDGLVRIRCVHVVLRLDCIGHNLSDHYYIGGMTIQAIAR